MEDTLRAINLVPNIASCACLNPCFNGRYSQRKVLAGKYLNCGVLILVLMEDTLRVSAGNSFKIVKVS